MVSLYVGVMAGDARQEAYLKKLKNIKNGFARFHQTTQNDERELPREQKTRGWVQQHCTFGGSRLAIYMVRKKRCTPVSDAESSDRRPGERVGREVI